MELFYRVNCREYACFDPISDCRDKHGKMFKGCSEWAQNWFEIVCHTIHSKIEQPAHIACGIVPDVNSVIERISMLAGLPEIAEKSIDLPQLHSRWCNV